MENLGDVDGDDDAVLVRVSTSITSKSATQATYKNSLSECVVTYCFYE